MIAHPFEQICRFILHDSARRQKEFLHAKLSAKLNNPTEWVNAGRSIVPLV
jgi:hypothetical protein